MDTVLEKQTTLDKKLERAQNQVLNGESTEFNTQFLDTFFQEAKVRNSIK